MLSKCLDIYKLPFSTADSQDGRKAITFVQQELGEFNRLKCHDLGD